MLEIGADVIVLATGSQPSRTGYQRGLPTLDRLPGADASNVWAIEDVMGRAARLGKRVLLLDDLGQYRGIGTAWHLLERDHEVAIVTPDPFVGREIVRSAADYPIRERLKQLGATFITESAVVEWHGDAATIVDLLDSSQRRLEFDALVLATVNTSQAELGAELAERGVELHSVGDCVAPRQAPAAIFEGRRLALSL